jgi:hypothetical protein
MTQSGTAGYSPVVPQNKVTVLAGSFLPNGSSAVETTYGAVGWSVARTGTGVFRVTITRPFAAFVSVTTGLAIDDVNSHELPASALTVPTSSANGYFDITHLTSADVSATDLAAADITASGALRRISFIAVLADSDVPGNGV